MDKWKITHHYILIIKSILNIFLFIAFTWIPKYLIFWNQITSYKVAFVKNDHYFYITYWTVCILLKTRLVDVSLLDDLCLVLSSRRTSNLKLYMGYKNVCCSFHCAIMKYINIKYVFLNTLTKKCFLYPWSCDWTYSAMMHMGLLCAFFIWKYSEMLHCAAEVF